MLLDKLKYYSTEELYLDLVRDLGAGSVSKFNLLPNGQYRSIIVTGNSRKLMITPEDKSFILSAGNLLNSTVISTNLDEYMSLEVDRSIGVGYIVTEYIKTGRFITIDDNKMVI